MLPLIILVVILFLISAGIFFAIAYFLYKKAISAVPYERDVFLSKEEEESYNISRLFRDDVDFSEEIVSAKSGLNLNLKMYKNKDSKSKKYILFHHGIKTAHFAAYKYFVFLLKKDYVCITYDSRGWGDQAIDDLHCTYGVKEKDDLRDVIEYLHNNKEIEKIVLMGESMGGLTCLEYITNYGTSKIDYLVCDGAVTDFETTLNMKTSQLLPHLPKFVINLSFYITKKKENWSPHDLKPYKSLRKIRKLPILFIHTKNDKVVPFWNFRKVYKLRRSNPNFKYSIYKKANHVSELSENYEKYTNTFFEFCNDK